MGNFRKTEMYYSQPFRRQCVFALLREHLDSFLHTLVWCALRCLAISHFFSPSPSLLFRRSFARLHSADRLSLIWKEMRPGKYANDATNIKFFRMFYFSWIFIIRMRRECWCEVRILFVAPPFISLFALLSRSASRPMHRWASGKRARIRLSDSFSIRENKRHAQWREFTLFAFCFDLEKRIHITDQIKIQRIVFAVGEPSSFRARFHSLVFIFPFFFRFILSWKEQLSALFRLSEQVRGRSKDNKARTGQKNVFLSFARFSKWIQQVLEIRWAEWISMGNLNQRRSENNSESERTCCGRMSLGHQTLDNCHCRKWTKGRNSSR